MNRQCPYVLDLSGTDIHAEVAHLHQQGPATRVILPGGLAGWVLSGSDTIRALLVDPRVSKDGYRHWPAWISGEVGAEWPLAIWVSVQNMITAYGPEHTRLRKPVAAAFTARRVGRMRPLIEEVADELLDRLAELPPDTVVDLRTAFGHELPTRIVFELFGIPERSWAPLHTIIKGFFDTTITAEDAQANGELMYATMTDLLAHRRAHPGDDITTVLINARDEGDGSRLSEKELIDNLILLLTAGYETSVNLICSAVHALLGNPGQLELVRSGGAEWDDVVEETLRLEPPATYGLMRFAVEDIEMADGVVIPKGDPIVVSFGSAGRDPAVHGPDAGSFDITRATRGDHLSFGFGTHHCLGASLARLECRVGVERLFDRFPDLSLAVRPEELRTVDSFISNGLESLPVFLGAAR
ncbi:cytochrome P450 (plasmid) [Streptomyces sp. NBC_00536]|uniref:cytochrome P450 family protein n=1 Tax=Streptomyces sp. NBC_00536 TaxID=2975769 RepID=UPI002E80BD1B|nr:cytochrome P450 [Streptomyces sp. NBC_00536]WUC84287.1 cytochrome P450 [Streptomyces sp. NBC_00536]